MPGGAPEGFGNAPQPGGYFQYAPQEHTPQHFEPPAPDGAPMTYAALGGEPGPAQPAEAGPWQPDAQPDTGDQPRYAPEFAYVPESSYAPEPPHAAPESPYGPQTDVPGGFPPETMTDTQLPYAAVEANAPETTTGEFAMPPGGGFPPERELWGEGPHMPHGRRKIPGPQSIVKLVAAAAAVAVVAGGTVATVAATTGGSDGDDKVAAAPRDAVSDADRKAAEEERRKLLMDRASRHSREESSKAPPLAQKGTPLTDEGGENGTVSPTGPVSPGSARAIAKKMLPSFGFSESQFGCLDNLWMKESGWRTNAANPSGAYGIPQALPGSKMASAGSDWRTSAKTQIKWGLGYVKGRYKTPCGAWGHFQSSGWY